MNNPAKLRDPSGHVSIVNNIKENKIPAHLIPSQCPPNSKACTHVSYAYVFCDGCDPDKCPPFPVYPSATMVIGGLMYLPIGRVEQARDHEYGCHINPAIDAAVPMLSQLEATPFWSAEACMATCQAVGQAAVNKFFEALQLSQENEANCKIKVR